MITWTIDRIEGNIAVIEVNGELYEVPIVLLPNPKEGDIIHLHKQDATENQALEEANARLERLKQRSEPPSDIFDL